MESQQTENIQKRLEQRRGFRKYKNSRILPSEGKRSKQDFSDKKNKPSSIENSSHQLINHNHYKKYYKIDTEQDSSIEPLQKEEGFKPQIGYLSKKERIDLQKSLKLPQLNPKIELMKIDKNRSSKLNYPHYHTPTASAVNYKKQNDRTLKRSSNKRICSVHCMDRYKQSRLFKYEQTPPKKKYERARNFERQRQLARKSQSALQEYLEGQSKARYPQSQLKAYLGRMKLKQVDMSRHRNLHYETYFGRQPQFSKLVTEYARQLNEPSPSIDQPQLYTPHSIPSVPQRDKLIKFIENFTPFSKDIDLQSFVKTDNFLVQYSPDQLYLGEMLNNQREGLGILITEKHCFQGTFKDDQKVKGVQRNSSGVYRGEFRSNKRDGYGEFQWVNGQTYIGDWKDGHRHGNGVWTSPKGHSYNGQWIRGKGYGYGSYISDGRIYHGDFFDFKKDGWGRQKLPNGDNYQGGFKGGIPEGKGIYIWANGTKYQGQFSRGFRTGRGTITTLDGFSYSGQFSSESAQGFCELLMPNGDFYKGNFLNGKKNGRGIFIFSRGETKLDGYWQDDRFLSKVLK